MPDLLESNLSVPIVFRRRPIDIPGEMRPAWRIAFIVLMLHQCCRGGQSSIRRLHVFNWCSKTVEGSNLLRRAVSERLPPGSILVRIEPSLARAVDFAIGAGVLQREGKDRIKLSNEGRRLAVELIDDDSVLARQKQWATALGNTVTETFVDSIFMRRDS